VQEVSDYNDILIAEYNNCAQVANHVDNVRNVITSFFLTINGGVLVVLTLVAKGEVNKDAFGSPKSLLVGVIITVCILGAAFTGTLARLRRVQSERYHVANRILGHFLDDAHRSIVALDSKHLAEDAGGTVGLSKRTTGTYMWTLAVMLPTAALVGLTTYLIVTDINAWGPGWLGWPLAALASFLAFAVADHFYFRLSTFTPPGSGHPAAEEGVSIV
jgi:hypothetical protein